MDQYCQRYWNFGVMWKLEWYLGSCGKLSLSNLFMSWKAFTKHQKHDRNVLQQQLSDLQQLQEAGIIEESTFFSIMVPRALQEDEDIEEVSTPHEDGDTEEFDPQYEWPDTDDGF